MAFARDGRLAALSTCGSIRTWDVQGRSVLVIQEQSRRLAGLAFDGARLICGVAREVHVWDAQSGRRLHILKGARKDVNCIALSPDGSQVAVGAGRYAMEGELHFQGVPF